MKDHPWREWASADDAATRMPGRAEPLECRERICRGSRCGSSACAKSNTITCRVIAFGTLRFFFDGGRTNRRVSAATTSSRSRHLSSSRRFSARLSLSVSAVTASRVLVRIQRLLPRPNVLRHMLQIDANARPVRRSTTHRIDQHVGRCEMRDDVGMTRFPTFEARERIVLALRAADLDQRMLARAAARRLNARRLAGLLLVLRRPRRIAEPVALMTRRQLEQSLRASRSCASMPSCRSPNRANREGIVASVKSAGSHESTSSQFSGADTRASAVGRTEYAAAVVRSFAFWL